MYLCMNVIHKCTHHETCITILNAVLHFLVTIAYRETSCGDIEFYSLKYFIKFNLLFPYLKSTLLEKMASSHKTQLSSDLRFHKFIELTIKSVYH